MTPHRFSPTSLAGVVSAIIAIVAPAIAQEVGPRVEPADQESTVIRHIDVSTRDVFSEPEADGNIFYWLANFLHWTTDPVVARRELWFAEGDRVTAVEVEELQRNLRSMRLFGEVRTELTRVDEDTSDLEIWTRDKFSLILSASVSSVGGVETFRGAIGESNLFGQGKRLRLSGRSDDKDESLLLQYEDLQLFGTWYKAFITVGTSTEGPVFTANVFKPFRHLGDPLSHGAQVGVVPVRADYFLDGETIAEVPLETTSASAFLARAFGPRDRRVSVGADIAWFDARYDDATGDAADQIRVPGDTTELQVGVRGTVNWAAEFRKVRNLDTLDFVQDLQLGVVADVRPGLAWRDEEGAGSELQPLIGGRIRAAASPFEDTYVTAEFSGSSRFGSGGVLAYESRSALHVFQQSLPRQTLALALRYDTVHDEQGLPRQLTLGEDNGLRGYPARQFTGTTMTVLNLEDRISTGIEVLSVQVGGVAFADVGWPGGQSPDAGESFSSVGLGLRFGSSNLFGSNVFRLDFAWPLDDQNGQEFEASLSFSAGQVFRFFGFDSGLSDDVVGLQ